MRLKALLFYGFFAAALAIGISWLFFNNPASREEGDGTLKDSRVIATVNGKEIHALELNNRFLNDRQELLGDPQTLRKMQLAALDKLIMERLILQDARNQDISVSSEEVMEVVQRQFAAYGEEDFRAQLDEHNISFDQFKSDLENEMIINKYNDMLLRRYRDEIEITDQEVKEYYLENKDQFNVSEVSMLVFEVPPPRDQQMIDSALKWANEAIRLIVDGLNLQQVYQRLQSEIEPAQIMLVRYPLNNLSSKERELVSELEPGEIYQTPVWITNSYRVIKREDESYQTVDEVRSYIINEYLLPQKLLDKRENHLEELRQQADIKVMLK